MRHSYGIRPPPDFFATFLLPFRSHLKVVCIYQWYYGEVLASLKASLWPFECSVGPVAEESRALEP